MQEGNGAADNYLLGHTPRAIQRLLRLGQIYQPFTRRVLIEAGVTAGMSVLDIGCGPGEVSLLAAELVGYSITACRHGSRGCPWGGSISRPLEGGSQ